MYETSTAKRKTLYKRIYEKKRSKIKKRIFTIKYDNYNNHCQFNLLYITYIYSINKLDELFTEKKRKLKKIYIT